MSTLEKKSGIKPVATRKGIPQLSTRITRSKAEIQKKSHKVESQKPPISANREIVGEIKKGITKPNEDNLVSKKRITNDRRGISEIKRSESNLQEKILILKEELSETKQSLVNAKYTAEEKNEKALTLVQELKVLKSENQGLIDLLEREIIDPVAQTKRNISAELKSLLERKKENSENEATLLMQELKMMNESPLNNIESLNFNFDIPE